MAYDLMLLKEVNVSELGIPPDKIKVPVNYIFDFYSNDIQFDEYGRLMLYEGRKKLIQNLLKAFLTEKGKNIEDADYGSGLDSLIGRKANASLFTDINETVSDCITKYVELNSDFDNEEEFIDSLDNITVSRDDSDPRGIFITIDMTLYNGDPFRLTIPIIEGTI